MSEILVLDIAASKTGARSVLEDFYKYVTSLGTDDHWTFVTGVRGILEENPESNVDIILRDDVKASAAARLKFEFLTGGAWINKISPDIVFSLENMIPRGVASGVRQVLYIHQPVGFQTFRKFSIIKPDEREQGLYQRFYHPLILKSAKRADAAVVQTGWMREALISQTGIEPSKVHIVEPDIPDFSAYVKPDEFDNKKFFFPASDLPYKNHAVIEEARIILADKGYAPEVMYTKEKVYPRERILEEYNRSTLIFPSYLETYGMPLGEARQFGNPMLVADTGFAREVLKGCDNVYYFEPFDADKLAYLMQEVMDGHIIPGKPQRTDTDRNSYGELVDIILNKWL